MTAAIGVLLGLMVGAALLLLLAGLTPHTSSPTSGRPVRSRQRGWAQLTRRPAGSAGRRRDLVWAGLVGVGVVGYVVSGWIVLIVLVPACGIALPWLLSNPNSLAIARTSAIEAWVRSLRSLLLGGSNNTLEQVIMASTDSVQEPLTQPVNTLVSRLRARWSIERALAAFADEVNDSTADTIAATLMLAARQRAGGLAVVLEGLADSVEDTVRARRKVEQDTAMPRTAARYITALFAVVVVSMIVFFPSYVEPYRSGIGQVILVCLFVFYVVNLWVIRVATTRADDPRIYPVAAREASHAR